MEVELPVPVASSTVGEVEAVALLGADEEFALVGFPEFVRSGDGFCGDAPLELEVGELTDPVLPEAAAAPSRAASWSPVTHAGLWSLGLSEMQSLPTVAAAAERLLVPAFVVDNGHGATR